MEWSSCLVCWWSVLWEQLSGSLCTQIGNSEAAARAKDFLRNSEKLKAEIGTVKDFGNIVTGSVNFQNGKGAATLNLKVIGERKTVNATVELFLRKRRHVERKFGDHTLTRQARRSIYSTPTIQKYSIPRLIA